MASNFYERWKDSTRNNESTARKAASKLIKNEKGASARSNNLVESDPLYTPYDNNASDDELTELISTFEGMSIEDFA